MDSKALLARLVEEGILIEEGDTVSVSDSFEDTLADVESTLTEQDSIEEYLRDAVDDDRIRRILRNVDTRDRHVVVRYFALRDAIDDLSHPEAVQALMGLETLQRGPPRSSGAPDAFVPVYGNQLPYLLEFVQRAVVYVWRNDCEPCDVMVETFDEMLDDPPQDVALFTVYGPDSAKLLKEEYNVTGGPATLFVVDGSVDSRVYGATYAVVVENELNQIRES